MKTDESGKLTIELVPNESGSIPVKALCTVLSSTVSILNDIEKNMYSLKRAKTVWVIEAIAFDSSLKITIAPVSKG